MTATQPRVVHLLVGAPEHGVVRYGIAVHHALAADGHRVVSVPDAADAVGVIDALPCDIVHLQFTDRLFGTSPAAAVHTVTAFADALRHRGIGLTATLHDLPQDSDGTGRDRRIDCYRTVLAILDGAVVSSDHEVALVSDHLRAGADHLRADGVESPAPVMIPLLVEAHHDTGSRPPRARDTVGVLGFLYPGKGHIETLHAMDHLPIDVGFVALGAPSPGHAHLVDELLSGAAESGRSVEVTGFLDDDELHRRMAEVTVPVAHHRHMSASASVNTWRSRRRAPLVPRTRYTDEIASRSAGTVTIYTDDDAGRGLSTAIERALADPDSTWIPDGVPVYPTPAQVAAAHRAFFAGVVR